MHKDTVGGQSSHFVYKTTIYYYGVFCERVPLVPSVSPGYLRNLTRATLGYSAERAPLGGQILPPV